MMVVILTPVDGIIRWLPRGFSCSRRPLVLTPDAAREWLRESLSGDEAGRTAKQGAVPAEAFTWHPVSPAVGNVRNQGASLIEPLS